MKLISFFRGQALTLKELNSRLKTAFARIKEEMDDHLLAINENTNEISSQYEYICELENKIERLQERVEQLQLYVYGSVQPAKRNFIPEQLSAEEKQIFTAVYTLEEEKGSVTYEDLSLALEIDINDVESRINALISKNVPIIKRYIDSNAYLKIDKDFKLLQAKENVLDITH